MTDPEIEYRRLVSGDPAAVRTAVERLDAALHSLSGVRADLAAVEEVPVWSGPAAMAFFVRVAALRQGLSLTRAALVRARGALETAASAYETAEDHGRHYIAYWRNRPAGLPAVIEEIFARVVCARLVSVGRTYNEQVAGIEGMLTGQEVDLDALDEETRRWVEEGLAKNEAWLAGTGSGWGPLIPNTAATGDDRGWIPQGLGYDPATGQLLQGYYTKNGDGHGEASYLALVDEVTGKEVGEVRLGGFDRPGEEGNRGPVHAGGVTVVGRDVVVVDNGTLYTYSLQDIRAAAPGATVAQSAAPLGGLSGGSYSAFKDGRLYLGDHDKDTLYVYERGPTGSWVEVDTMATPPQCQGVLVRDDELVFSSSYGRHADHSRLYVQDFAGNRSEAYHLPSMSQGVVEVDGQVVVTYESGAEEFDHPDAGTSGWWWGRDDHQDLWANPYMTRTPLSELGLSEDVVVEPGTLLGASSDFAATSDDIQRVADDVAAVRVPGHVLGEVPRAASLVAAVEELVGSAADSLSTGARAVQAVSELLVSTADDYTRTDDRVSGAFRGVTPR